MEIVVTIHALNRYRERMFDFTSTDEKIINRIKDIVCQGEQVFVRPSAHNNCREIQYRGVSVVIIQERHKIFVITCLGSRHYRKWFKEKNNHKRVCQSFLYPTKQAIKYK